MAMNGPNFSFATNARTADEIFNELKGALKDEPTLTVRKEDTEEQSFRIVVSYQKDPNNPIAISESRSEMLHEGKKYKEVLFAGGAIERLVPEILDTGQGVMAQVGSINIPKKTQAQKVYESLSPNKRRIVQDLMDGKSTKTGERMDSAELVSLIALSEALKP